MTSTGTALVTQPGPSRSRRRSASASPSRSPLPERPLKRKRTLGILPIANTQPQSGGQLYYRRKSSLFTKFSWSKRNSGFDKMTDSAFTDGSREEASSHLTTCGESSNALYMNDFIHVGSGSAGESRRTSSRLSSISSQIKSFFTDRRRRRDSPAETLQEYALDFETDPQSLCLDAPSSTYIKPDIPLRLPSVRSGSQFSTDIRHDASLMGLDPFAVEGSLCYANKSSDSIQFPPGPSDYWREEEYHGRECLHQKQSPYCGSADQGFFFNGGPVNQDTTASAASADAGWEKYPWDGRDGHSSSPSPKHKPSLTFPHLRLPSFGRKKRNAKGKQAVSRDASCAPSITSSNFSFGRDLNLNFTVSINDLGVLPNSDVPSVENSVDIPHPLFTSMTTATDQSQHCSQTSLLPRDAAPSEEHDSNFHLPQLREITTPTRSSSLIPLRPASLQPTSRPPTPHPCSSSLNPSAIDSSALVNPQGQRYNTAAAAAAIDFAPTLDFQLNQFNNVPLQPHYRSLIPSSRGTSPCTTANDESDNEMLALRRAWSLSAVLKGNEVDGRARFSFELDGIDVDGGDGGVKASREAGNARRGRSRIRRGSEAASSEDERGEVVDEMDLD